MSISDQQSREDPSTTWRKGVQTFESLHEEVTIFGNLERLDGCSEDPDTEAVKDAHLVKGDANVQGALTPESE